MTARQFVFRGLMSILVATSLGCPTPSQTSDAGSGTDSGSGGTDSGSGVDSGSANDSGSPDSGGPPDSGTVNDGGQTITITANQTVHHLTDSTTMDVLTDFSAGPINVFVPDPNADGGYDIYPGTGTTNGTLSVPNVPAGLTSLYLQIDNSTYVEDVSAPFNTSLDLSAFATGRPNVAVSDAGVDFEISGLTPWDPTQDALVWASAGAGLGKQVPRTYSDGGSMIATGGTTLSSIAQYNNTPLIDATQGDITVAYQMASQDDGGAPLVVGASAGFQTNTFSMVPGATSLLDAGFQPLTQQGPVAWTYDNAGFSALQGDVSPVANSLTQSFGISATPYALQIFVATNDTATANWSASGTFGNPFPSTSRLYGFANGRWNVLEQVLLNDGGTPTLPDGGGLFDVEQVVASYTDALASLPAADGGTLSPTISPPTGALIDGSSFYIGQALASTTPVLTWNAPTTGTPLYYEVQIDHVSWGTRGLIRRTFHVYTVETSLQLFLGLLLPGGKQYVIRIIAVTRPNGSFSTPFIGSWPEGSVATISGVLTTP